MKKFFQKLVITTLFISAIFVWYLYAADEGIPLWISSPGYNQILNTSDIEFSFSWNTPYTFQNYTYTISGYRNGKFYTWKYDTSWEISFTKNLIDWKYQFGVIMNYIDDKWDPWSKAQYEPFTVYDDVYLDIKTPSTTVTSQTARFSRTWSADTFDHYYCEVKKGSTILTWFEINSIGNNSFNLSDLQDWSHDFTVTMYYTWWRSISDSIRFTVRIQRTLTIPDINKVTQKQHTFSRNWSAEDLINYTYTLESSNWYHRSNTTNNNNFSVSDLTDWSYTLTVSMNCDWDTITKSKTFLVDIDKTLSVTTSIDSNNATLWWTWFAENFHHYEYSLIRTDISENIISGTRNTYYTWFTVQWLHYWNYTLTVNMKDSWWSTITWKSSQFQISDQLSFSTNIYSWDTKITEWETIKSRSATFTWSWQSEDLSWFYYEVSGTTFKNEEYLITWIQISDISWDLYKSWTWSITLTNLQTGRYRFTVKMLSGNTTNTSFTEQSIDFDVSIPTFLQIISPTSWSTITSSNATFSRTWYSDVITRYDYKLTSDAYNLDTNNFTTNTSFSRNDLKDWNYTLTVRISSWGNLVAEDTVNFTVKIPAKSSWGWWSSSKSHPTNNLSLSIWNESPSANEWIQLIVKISDKYTWKVSFPKIQYYSWDTEKWIDIPVTSKNFVSDYSDDAKLWYVRFTSDDDWRKDLNQFIKFSKNWHYRIYAEDKDWFDTYVQIHVWAKKTITNTWTTNSTWDVNSILREYIPEIFENTDTQEEVYIARSCKKYTIIYSDTLNIYTSPNLNISEFFINKDYLKRYLDSKNRYQSWCPTNIWWITTSYIDRTNSSSRYTAPNGKVYLIVWEEWNYYSNELNRELKTPTSFKTIAELKYYIRDRNPLINMATLWPVN